MFRIASVIFCVVAALAPPADASASVASHLADKADVLSQRDRKQIARAIEQSAQETNLAPELILAVIDVESSFRRYQKSKAGALGLMQVMPTTGKYIARRHRLPWRGRRTLFQPKHNIRIGARYLRRLIRYFGGDVDLALTAYCHGPAKVRRWVKRDQLTRRRLRYSRKVKRARRLYVKRSKRHRQKRA